MATNTASHNRPNNKYRKRVVEINGDTHDVEITTTPDDDELAIISNKLSKKSGTPVKVTLEEDTDKLNILTVITE